MKTHKGRRFDVTATTRKTVVLVATFALLLPGLTFGAGFALFEHGNRGMAMAGAMTGLADDASAVYWNPAGLVFQQDKGKQLVGGFTLIAPEQDFTGESPFPGTGYTASQESQLFYPLHSYFVMPINPNTSLGFGLLTPFGLGTHWDEDYAGRFLSKRANLMTFDFTGVISLRATDNLAVAVGVDYVVGTIDLTRQAGIFDPFSQRVVDVGQAHLYTDGFGNSAWGWNASFLAKLGGGWTFGGRYRSGFKIDFEGEGSFTQYSTGNPELDAIVAATLPFDENVPIETYIDFPDVWHVGLAWSNETWTVAASYGSMGWSSFQELPVTFTTRPDLSSTVLELYEDSNQYRIGLEYRASENLAFQAGYLFDETPQPIESMSPLLGDTDRPGYSVGISVGSRRIRTDIGYLYIPMDNRSTEGIQLDGYNGSYEGNAHLLGATLTLSF
jgi:long-chain fatty acid transport protein